MKRPVGADMHSSEFIKWFWSWLEETDAGCFEWRGTRNGDGYGRIGIKGKNTTTHRVMWTIEHGEIPSDKVIRHKCNNRACARLSHLAIGSPADNAKDTIASGRNWVSPDMTSTEPIQRRGNQDMNSFTPEFKNQFYANTKPNGDCLDWNGAYSGIYGYGRVMHDGKMQFAHRVVCQIEFGYLPDDKPILHTCGRNICVNVKHLKAGSS